MIGSWNVTTCLADNADLRCGFSDDFEFSSNADIAGRGVFISFAVAVFTAVIGAGIVLVIEYGEYFGHERGSIFKDVHPKLHGIRMLIDGYLLGLSDAQAITSLALLIPANFFLGCTMSAYHYDLVCSLVLMSTASYTGSMVVLHRYWSQKWWLGTLRLVIVFVIFILSAMLVYRRGDIFPSYKPHSNITSGDINNSTGLVLPAACFIDHPDVPSSGLENFTASPAWLTNYTMAANSSIVLSPNSTSADMRSNSTLSIFSNFESNDTLGGTLDKGLLTCLIIVYASALLMNLILPQDRKNASTRHKVIYCVRWVTLIFSAAISFLGFGGFQALQNWMKESGWFADDDGEASLKSFGQMMPLLLLIIPVLTAMEQFGPAWSSFRSKKSYGKV